MAATDLLTVAEVKDVLEVESTDHDLELEALVAAVSVRVDRMCGPVVARTIANELHDGGTVKIRPKFTPIYSVTTLIEYDETVGTTLTAETNASKPADGYMTIGDGRWDTYIVRRSANCDYRFVRGRRNIDLTYEAGRFADTASVDDLFKRAGAMFVTHLWKSTGPVWHTNRDFFDEPTPTSSGAAVPSFAVPRAVRELLADELLPVVA